MNSNNPEHPIPTDHSSPINSDNDENPKQSTTRSIPIYRKNKTYYYPITFESASSLTHHQQQQPFQPSTSNTPITPSSNPKPYISKTSQTKPSSFFIKKNPKQTQSHAYPKIPFSNHTISNCFCKNLPIANVDNNESLSFYPKIRKRIIMNQHFHINNCISTSPINNLCNDESNNCIRKYRSLSNRNIFRKRYENKKVVIRKEGKNKGVTERKNVFTKERHLCPFLDIDVIVRKRGNLTPNKSTGSIKKKVFQEESKKIIKKRYFRFLQDKFDKNGDINYDSYNWLFDAMKNHRRRMYDPTNV